MGIGTHDGSVGMGWMPTMQPLLLQPDALPMNIIVNEELKAYIDPLTTEEYEALERSILAEGCRDALVLWCSGTTCWSMDTTVMPSVRRMDCRFKRCRAPSSTPSKMCTCG